MLIFAIVSLPCLFLIVSKKISSKDTVLFFYGIVISSIISIITWALSTFYYYESDSLFNIQFKFFIIIIIPLIILFGYYSYLIFSNFKYFSPIPKTFVSGYLYWNLIFSLILDIRISSHSNILIMPIFYMLILLLLLKITDVVFAKYDLVLRAVLIAFIPVIVLFFSIILSLSILAAILILIFGFCVVLILKLNLWDVKTKLFP